MLPTLACTCNYYCWVFACDWTTALLNWTVKGITVLQSTLWRHCGDQLRSWDSLIVMVACVKTVALWIPSRVLPWEAGAEYYQSCILQVFCFTLITLRCGSQVGTRARRHYWCYPFAVFGRYRQPQIPPKGWTPALKFAQLAALHVHLVSSYLPCLCIARALLAVN